MLTVAYVRVSTEEQATEGFSIAGQAEKVRQYAALHDLGEVTIIEDAGLSGKNLERPGLQRLLQMVEDGHVQHVVLWKLCRLSRNLGDLIDVADRFGQRSVGLHSVSEQLDLSTPTGRMMFNIIGTFAQFYREQLAENVRMGIAAAKASGKHIGRPKFGYDKIDGELVPNEHAATVRRMFRMRADGKSMREIERATGVEYSVLRTILLSRLYRGELPHHGGSLPGRHEPLVSEAEWQAAQRWQQSTNVSKHPLAGRVFCGGCGRRSSAQQTHDRRYAFRCRHRGSGCAVPRRRSEGLEEAMLLGLRLLRDDQGLRQAIDQQLEAARSARPDGRAAGGVETRELAAEVRDLEQRQRQLLELHYKGAISPELFAREESALAELLQQLRGDQVELGKVAAAASAVSEKWADVEAFLAQLDFDVIWDTADDDEKRKLVTHALEGLTIHTDHIEVRVSGAPPLVVLPEEVGFKPGKEPGKLPERPYGASGGT